MDPQGVTRFEADGDAPPVTPGPRPVPGRGVAANPSGRFEPLRFSPEEEALPGDDFDVEGGGGGDGGEGAAPGTPPRPRTTYLLDASKSAISWNDSPDVGFEASLNPYRGCEHGCSYCYARPYHEYLGLSAGLDFETKILVKRNLPALLEAELAAPRWSPRVLALCGVTDAYQPVERRLRLTRACLEVLVRFRNPVGIVTKGALVERDTDLLADLARDRAAMVWISLTSLDRGLQRALEPRASTPEQRLGAMRTLSAAGVPVGVMVAPVIPGLNDHEVPALLEAAGGAGARYAGSTVVRLPHGVKDLFSQWLRDHRPLAAEKVLGRIRDLRGGSLNDSRFGTRMEGQGEWARQLRALFDAGCRRAGLSTGGPDLSTAAFRRPGPRQLGLFEPVGA